LQEIYYLDAEGVKSDDRGDLYSARSGGQAFPSLAVGFERRCREARGLEVAPLGRDPSSGGQINES